MPTIYGATTWTIVLGMFAWAAYLDSRWSGVETLPMQWGITGRPTWYAERETASFSLPIVAAVVLVFMCFVGRRRRPSHRPLLLAVFLLRVQVLLARRDA